MTSHLGTAWRILRAAPGLVVTAVLTIAIGIGAVTAAITLVRAVLVRPPAFDSAGRVVFLRGQARADASDSPLGYLDIESLARDRTVFSAVSPVTGSRSFNLSAAQQVEHITGEMVGAEFFEVLTVRLHAGRMFTEDETRPPTAAKVVIISHDLWQRRFGGMPTILGQTIRLNDRSFEVIGVAGPGFAGITDQASVWLPIGAAHDIYGPTYTGMRGFRWLSAIARLRDDVTIAQAAETVRATADRLAADWPKENRHLTVTTSSLIDRFFGDVKQPLSALLGAATLVLLIACMNVSNLQLARGLSRQKEFATRLALGAHRSRLIAQLLTESLMLACLGAVGGVVLAWLFTALMADIVQSRLASFVDVRIDMVVLATTIGISSVAALLVGAMPALVASRVSPLEGLKDDSRGATQSSGRARAQAILITLEVTLSLTMLAGTALMTKGLAGLVSSDLGFEAEGLLSSRLDLTAERYRDNERYWQVARDVTSRMLAEPGVEAVTIEGPGYPTYGAISIAFRPEGAAPDSPFMSAARHHVTPGYFATLGIPLVSGRDFAPSDSAASPGRLIVSEAFARRQWPSLDPIGQRLTSTGTGAPTIFTVIGVVGDVRHDGLVNVDAALPDVYLSLYQFAPRLPPVITVMARTSGDPSALRAPMRRALDEAAPDLPTFDSATMAERLRRQTTRGRSAVTIMAAFSAIALILAGVGVYGLVSYHTTQRTREIGIRLALGATPRSVFLMVVGRSAWPVATGIVAGLVCAATLAPFIAGMLYGLNPVDPQLLFVAAAALAATGLAAAYRPARRASRINPSESMRAGA